MKIYMKDDLRSSSPEWQCLSPVSNGAKEFDRFAAVRRAFDHTTKSANAFLQSLSPRV